MGWVSNGDSSYWVEDTPEPGQWIGGGGDAPAQFIPDIPVAYAGGGGDAVGWQIPLSQDYINSIQDQGNVSQSTGGLDTGAQGSAYVAPVSQKSANPDPTQAFNFVANPNVTAQNPFSKPINNAVQAYLGRPASQAEIVQFSQLLAQNPDNYNWLVNNIQNSPEAAAAAQSGKQQLIIDPRRGDMTNMWLGADYASWKPSIESGLSKVTNAIGGAIPLAALGVMTGGAGAALGLGAVAGGALAGGVTGAAGAGLNGGNVGMGALTGAALGGLGGAASGAFGGAGNVASGGLDLGSNFTWNIPTYEDQLYSQLTNAFANPNELGQAYAPTAGAKVTVEGAPSIYNDYGATNTPLVNATNNAAGDFASGGLDLGSNFTWNGLPLNEAVAGTGLTLGQILANAGVGSATTLASLLSGTTGGGVGGTGTGGVGTGTGGGGTGGGTGGGGAGVPGGGGTGGTGTAPGSTPTSKIPTTKLPIPKIPTTPTLSTALRNPGLYQSAPGGLYRGNVNPFTFGKDVPIQGERQNYDPFAALNVAQTPPQSNSNLMANLLRENIYG